MIIIVLCQDHIDVNLEIKYQKICRNEIIIEVNKQDKIITTEENTYIFIYEVDKLWTLEAHTWTLSKNAHFHPRLEELIKVAVRRCRLIQ